MNQFELQTKKVNGGLQRIHVFIDVRHQSRREMDDLPRLPAVLQLAARCPSGSADGAVTLMSTCRVADSRLTRKDVVSQDLQWNLMQ